ncbi:hypothetical protein S40288_07238 [Stachybotrys chartarum IBT 40288]|nr:hypothetical protein S40288_07238 [Stachybotrys chartarum IBT 40288]
MVNFFFWRFALTLCTQGDGSSTASFEKTLSTLAVKIANTQAKLDRLRSRSRRLKLLATMNMTFAYLVYTIVCLLVVGYKNMGAYEWTGLSGGPVLIYVMRKAVAAYYNFRIETLSTRVREQREERAKTIQKLKQATKYDSTQELIEKYGGIDGQQKEEPAHGDDGDEPKPRNQKVNDTRRNSSGRLLMPLPATANVQRPGSRPGTPHINQSPQMHQASNFMEPSAEFAPNADFVPDHYPSAAQSPVNAQQYGGFSAPPPAEHHWYDRVFDLLLGEDETAPKNRIVLICKTCRLVNGQAPPGTRALSDLGVWKCIACGTPNGEEDEGRRIMKEVLGSAQKHERVERTVSPQPETVGEDEDEEDDGPAASVRKRRGKAKK